MRPIFLVLGHSSANGGGSEKKINPQVRLGINVSGELKASSVSHQNFLHLGNMGCGIPGPSGSTAITTMEPRKSLMEPSFGDFLTSLKFEPSDQRRYHGHTFHPVDARSAIPFVSRQLGRRLIDDVTNGHFSRGNLVLVLVRYCCQKLMPET